MIKETSWSRHDKAAMLFGLYEKEILDSLSSIPSTFTHFINLGAADGYYGVGVVISGIFKDSICYEITNDGQEVIHKTAMINGVEDKVCVFGEAKPDFYKNHPQSLRDNSVLFLDVEGAEFEILNENVFSAFEKSIIISELHPNKIDHGSEELILLRKKSERTHTITEINTDGRDLSIFPELSDFSDNDRWLICSEGRRETGSWWRFDPL